MRGRVGAGREGMLAVRQSPNGSGSLRARGLRGLGATAWAPSIPMTPSRSPRVALLALSQAVVSALASCLAISHWVAATEGGIRVVDVWETKEQYERFAQEQIGPYSREVGIGAPETRFYDIHNRFG